ncbi:MAG: hypothetical protein K2Y22_16740 [Candidatus Obscuribacterales bacterium]|nr:hypothetical protein [Candidatus Obscuribacterales bacterium]
MNIRNEVTVLKQHLEHLFPGKWISGNNLDERHGKQKLISTGLPEIDHGLINGLSRQRITEWLGTTSSGKTTFLRNLISNWCSAGFNVAYIDIESRLLASDWAYLNQDPYKGRFWAVRLNNKTQDAVWAAEQLIRSHAFDVVILDLATDKTTAHNQSRHHARLQRALDKSRTALLILKDINSFAQSNSWGCHARFSFAWQKVTSQNKTLNQKGLSGITAILPAADLLVSKDGMSKSLAITPYEEGGQYVQNCLFTHPSIPDRRTPKA